MENKFGSYRVFDQTYHNKISAVSSALYHGTWPQWNFNEDEFSSHDWTTEPQESLEELYRQRCLAMRQKYDYLILSYSGGADCQNIAESFIGNGIRLDELINRSASVQIDMSNHEIDSTHHANESRRAAWPNYQKLRDLQPDLVFTHYDYSTDIYESWAVADTTLETRNYFSPNIEVKKNLIRQSRAPTTAKKIGLIFGVDKPPIFYDQSRFYVSFLDDTVHCQGASWYDYDDDRVSSEYFYWSPESIKILIKQAHIVKRWFLQHPALLHLLLPTRPDRTHLYDILNRLVYPKFDPLIWQVQKQNEIIATPEDIWFVQQKETTGFRRWLDIVQAYSSAVQSLRQRHGIEILKEHLGGLEINRLHGCWSKKYFV